MTKSEDKEERRVASISPSPSLIPSLPAFNSLSQRPNTGTLSPAEGIHFLQGHLRPRLFQNINVRISPKRDEPPRPPGTEKKVPSNSDADVTNLSPELLQWLTAAAAALRWTATSCVCDGQTSCWSKGGPGFCFLWPLTPVAFVSGDCDA